MRHRRRKGYTLLEVAISFACIGIIMAGVFAASSYMSQAKEETDTSIVMNTFVISAIEIIKGDLDDGVDILSNDYNEDPRIFSGDLSTSIVIYFQEDVFGKTLYEVKLEMSDKLIHYRQTARVLLRGDAL